MEWNGTPSFDLIYCHQGATDVVVLRGWYNRITISLYGLFTDVNQRPQEPRPEPRTERPPVIVESRAPERDLERMDREVEKVPSERVPERAERAHERGLERPTRRERSADRGPPDLGPGERGTDERGSERSTEVRDRHEGQMAPRDERKGVREKERTPLKLPPRVKSPSRSPLTVTATVGESTAAKPTTPPGSPREEVCDLGLVLYILCACIHFMNHFDLKIDIFWTATC